MTQLKERFWSKVDIKGKDNCWNWKASTSDGYGRFGIDRVIKLAHRVSWILTNGPIPEGKLVLHNCDNKLCVNPNHLYIGTHLDNMSDVHKRNPIGPGMAKAKLYEGEIWLIRKLCIPINEESLFCHRRYKFPAQYIAKMFKVSYPTILNIWNSKKYLCKEGYYA